MIKNRYISFGIAYIMVLMLAGSVSALAVSSPYWPDNPLRISPGESVDLQLKLKNNAGTEDLSVTAEVIEGVEVVMITDASNTYAVPAGGEAAVSIRVSVPADSAIGGNYPVKFSFKTVTSGETEETMNIGSAIEQSLPVVVVEKPSEGMSNLTIYLIIAVIVLVIAIGYMVSRKKR